MTGEVASTPYFVNSPITGRGTKAHGILESATLHRRTVFISLSSLLRRWDSRGVAILAELPEDSLFFFGSKRSWVFPATEAELEESRSENPRYICRSYQPLRDLIKFKEARGEVYWLKPQGFEYNGSLYHGHPDAFPKASDWLQSLNDPTTGDRYAPLLLDPQWWNGSFKKEDAKYTSASRLIVKNFLNGAHDYAPVMELLHQSNPTLDIVH